MLCSGDSLAMNRFSLPLVARCEGGQMYLDTAYAGIQFRQKEKDTLVLSDGRPRVYLLGRRGNKLEGLIGLELAKFI